MASAISTDWLRHAHDQLHGVRVLLVDDNVESLQLTSSLLQALGCLVATCSQPDFAVEQSRRFRPDVVFLDISMPGMNGVEVAEGLRGASGRQPAIVAVSGYSRDAVRRSVGDADFDDYLTKPVSLVQFYEVLVEQMRQQE